MNSASIKAKGREAENGVVEFLKPFFRFAERRRLTGAHDKGDIAGVPHTVLEVKNCARLDLAGWMAELEEEIAHAGAKFGAVIHKRKGTTQAGKWYVTLPLWRFVDLLVLALQALGDK